MYKWQYLRKTSFLESSSIDLRYFKTLAKFGDDTKVAMKENEKAKEMVKRAERREKEKKRKEKVKEDRRARRRKKAEEEQKARKADKSKTFTKKLGGGNLTP